MNNASGSDLYTDDALDQVVKNRRRRRKGKNLELGGLHGDGDANEEDAEHGDGGVPFPVLGAAVGPARHAPHLGPEVLRAMRATVMMIYAASAHLASTCLLLLLYLTSCGTKSYKNPVIDL